MEPKRRDVPATTIGRNVFEWGARTFVMGVINVTPDSFSGDGIGSDVEAAVDQALRMQEHGADIVDVGGESTRPPAVYADAAPVPAEEELARVLPVIRALARAVDVPISIDTQKARVAEMALEAGASVINDIWGFRRDPDMARVAAESGVPVVLMHNQDHTRYTDVVLDVVAELRRITEAALAAGVARENIILDPGIGFGKTAQHNLEILRRLDEFRALGQPFLIGMSRKSTIGYVLDLPVDDRIEGTAATVALSIANGADIVRVHDVKQMARVAKMSDAIVRGWAGER
jgi:dihydropteroate synthase